MGVTIVCSRKGRRRNPVHPASCCNTSHDLSIRAQSSPFPSSLPKNPSSSFASLPAPPKTVLTQSCWLCLSAGPPYYEGIASSESFNNITSRMSCSWELTKARVYGRERYRRLLCPQSMPWQERAGLGLPLAPKEMDGSCPPAAEFLCPHHQQHLPDALPSGRSWLRPCGLVPSPRLAATSGIGLLP